MFKHHPFAFIVFVFVCFRLLAGCTTTPDGGRELSATGKVALQEVTTIALRRALTTSPRAAEKAANIREVAVRLQSASAVTTVAELRAVVDKEVAALNLSPVDLADAQSLLNIFQALLTEKLGKEDLDADALVTVNEFVSMVVRALPPPV